MEKVLITNALSKNYGRLHAVDSLDFEVCKGEVFGILGPNGSGKTTTLGMLLDVVNKSSGHFSWFGQSPTAEARKRIGSILEMPLFYPYLSGLNNLRIVADIKGIAYNEIPEVLERVGLTSRRNSKFKTYSLGMKQRLALAAALLGKPDVLILDEPSNGLDPQGIADIRRIILELASQGITIILASHLLDEVQKICSHVLVLDKGKKRFSGQVSELLSETTLVEVAAADNESLLLMLRQWEGALSAELKGQWVIVKLKPEYHADMLNAYVFSNDITLHHLAAEKQSLEQHFLQLLSQQS
jgi:ABC-2 type transport system ATP-binding protein